MAIWPSLTTRAVDKRLDDAIAHFIGASLLPLLLVVAGIRLWRHDSWPVCMQAAIG